MDEEKKVLTGKCEGCSHKCYDGSLNTICLGCKRQWYPNMDYDLYERKPDLYNEAVMHV